MTPISEINATINSPLLRVPQKGKWEFFKNLASMVCSRESTYRTALDITAFDFPLMAADIFRGPKKFIETFVEGLSAIVSIGVSPYLNIFIAKFLSKFIIMPSDMQKDTLHYLRFNMSELRDFEIFKEAKNRISREEVEDKNFIASLYENRNSKNVSYYKSQAKEIEEFCESFEPTEEKMKLIYKLKKATIIGESFIEGGWWGSFGILMRAFRKHVLGEERFTGTKGYASDAQSKQLGEASELNLFQKIWGGICIFIAPVVNTTLLNKVEDDEAVKNSSFLTKVKGSFDLTHGIYPKLGLLFSITSYPKWLGAIGTAQGNYERVERILKLLTVIPSWWLGHRVTNGLFALSADKEFSKKHSTEQGIFIEPEFLKPNLTTDSFLEKIGKKYPEPARIQHILKTIDEREKAELQNVQADNKSSIENIKLKYQKIHEEAEDLHARCLYKGFALHSIGVFAINMAVNYITKLRVKLALGQ